MRIPNFVYDEEVRKWWLRVVWVLWFCAMMIHRSQFFQNPLLVAFIFLVPSVYCGQWLFKSWRDRRRGYYINLAEYSADGSLLYREGPNVLLLYFERNFAKKTFTIHLWTDEGWRTKMPDWSKNRKPEIMGRIKNEFPRAHYQEHDDLDEVEPLKAKLEVRSWN